jgi:predicted Zn finger-like uncharacterized protein
MITECPNCGERFRVEVTPSIGLSEDYGVVCQNCGWAFPVRPIPRENKFIKWMGIIVIGFLIAGLIWSLLEGIEGRFGWVGVFLAIFMVIVAILVYLGTKANVQETKEQSYPPARPHLRKKQYLGSGRIGNSDTFIFHHPDCRYARQINDDKAIWFESLDYALYDRYKPCKICRPQLPYRVLNTGRRAYLTQGRSKIVESQEK